MKKYIYLAMSTVTALGLSTACSSDYLEVAPVTDITTSQLSDPTAAKLLVGGIYEAMNTAYSGLEVNQNVGEAQVMMNCGEACGTDLVSGLWTSISGLRTWSYISDPSAYMTVLPWMYYYNIINLSNYAIQAIPGTAEDPGEMTQDLMKYKAEALTMRAHGYTRLLGYYGNRWQDSDNGTTYCIVLRTEPGTGPSPLVTMNAVLDQIYADCAEAVALYEKSGQNRDEKYEADKSVANGVWARAALIKEDWATAAEKAKAARQGYTIMSQQELFSGFYSDNDEIIWSMNPTDVTTYYWSWGAHYACNGAYANMDSWGIGAGAINIDLYNEAKAISSKDLRLKFFLTPDKVDEVPEFMNPAGIKASDFWNSKRVTVSQTMVDIAAKDVYNENNKANTGLTDVVGFWLYNYYKKTFTGNESDIANDDNEYNQFVKEYVKSNPSKDVYVAYENGYDVYALVKPTSFGSQNKFWAIAPYGNMALPWMRASEMALTEAEAQYHLNNSSAALAALNEVQSKRIPGYTSSKSGEALLNEIRVCRRIELWGEGFNFLDLKRWNMPRVRRIWVKNDPSSGNCHPNEQANMSEAQIQASQSPKYCNGWRFALPSREYNYNDQIDMGLLKKIE